MKKIKLFILSIILSVTAFAQDIIIDFVGDGASAEVTTVEIVNLSNCTSIEVPGDAAFNLTTGTVVGIKQIEEEEKRFIQTFPNPFENSVNIQFYLEQRDHIDLTVCDISGKNVAAYNKELSAGMHVFVFTANKFGMYFINIAGSDFVNTSKIICLSNNAREAQLTYHAQTTDKPVEKLNKSDYSKEFSFTPGDTLKLKGISGDYDYATVIVREPTASETYTFNFVACQDGDGNNYAVTEIGNQTWMAENIRTTSYTVGGDIPLVTDESGWDALGDNNTDKAYCFYNNNANGEADIYGALYTYAAATNEDNSGTGVQGVCPIGWHVPSDAEWTALTDELGGELVAGGKLKSACSGFWFSPNTGANNVSGFSGLPGGYRNSFGSFVFIGMGGVWLSATEENDSRAWLYLLGSSVEGVYRDKNPKSNGHSVRCIKD